MADTKASASAVEQLEKLQMGSPYVMAVYTSAVAAVFIAASGKEILPIGGFTGTSPEPTINRFRSMIRAGEVPLSATHWRPRSPPDMDLLALPAPWPGRRFGRTVRLYSERCPHRLGLTAH